MSEDNKSILKKVAFWGVMTLLVYISLSILGSAESFFQSLINLTIMWAIGIFIYKKRHVFKDFTDADVPLTDYVKKKHSDNVEYRRAMEQHSRRNTLDNEALRPLDEAESQHWNNIINSINFSDDK